MKKVLSSMVSLVMQFFLLFLCSYVLFSNVSWRFQNYIYKTISIYLGDFTIPFAILLLIKLPTFIYSIWYNKFLKMFCKFNLSITALMVSILLIALFFVGEMKIAMILTVLVIPLIMFTLGILLLMVLTANIHSKMQTYIIIERKKYDMIIQEKIKSERFKTELITNVSHDIKTPLTSIINYIDLIKRLNIQNQTLHEYISVLDKKSLRLKMLINDLIEASKVGTGNIKIDMHEIDLIEIVGQVIGEFEEPFANAQLELVFNHLDENLYVISDGRHLWRIFENVFGNVLKYSLPNTRVYVDVKKQNDVIRFSLKNISKEKLGISSDELMEQFVRGDRSRHEEGSGLGLYIAKSLTELIGGQFSIVITGDMFEVVIDFYPNNPL